MPRRYNVAGMVLQRHKTLADSDRVESLHELVRRAVGGAASLPDTATVEVRLVCADSREVTPGALFVAIAGSRADGSAFVDEALRRGAAAVVLERSVRTTTNAVVVRVDDAPHALARLAAAFGGLDEIQASGGLDVVGVTGTNGKTTVAFMTRGVLQAADRPVALLGTIEYDLVARRVPAPLTTPDPIALTGHLLEAHAAGAHAAVMEVSSHALSQRRTDGVRFDAAVFTNLTQDHLDYHETLEAYLAAKRRLFERLDADAVAVVNADDPVADRIVEGCRARILRYGRTEGADVRATGVSGDRSGSRFTLAFRGERTQVFTPMVGLHNVSNALAAAAVGLARGLDPAAVARALESVRHVPGRLQRVATEDLGFDVFVDYAHTDDALRNVLTTARKLTRGRLSCVFGCGGDRDRSKRPRMARAVADTADTFVITSDNPRTEDPDGIIDQIVAGLGPDERHRSIVEPDRAAAIRVAIEQLGEGDTLVIAGKGHENYQILGAERIHFDDVECAEGAIARRRMTPT